MSLTINTNVASLNAQRNLGKSQNDLNQSMQRVVFRFADQQRQRRCCRSWQFPTA